jgi:excisionase family DNA binding protein
VRRAREIEAGEVPRLLGVAELAECLGVTERHVRRLVAERRIPFLKWGRLLRFDPREIVAFLDDVRVPPRSLSHPAVIVPVEDEFRVVRGARSGSRR